MGSSFRTAAPVGSSLLRRRCRSFRYLNWVVQNGRFPGPTNTLGRDEVKRELARDLLPV